MSGFPNLGVTMAEIEAGWPVVQERLRRLTEAFAISVEEIEVPELPEPPS